MEVYTIGFTKRSARDFFGALKQAGIRRLLDVRLNNTSQLAGYSKRDDLAYFLEAVGAMEYLHEPLLAPTQGLLDTYKKKRGTWDDYERGFRALLAERRVEDALAPRIFDVPTVLLCSERTAERCHRRLVLEYLRDKWGNLEIVHL